VLLWLLQKIHLWGIQVIRIFITFQTFIFKDDPTLSIRQPLGELNQRWNVLLKRLLDSQQRLERALLDMGQFSQAHAQLVDWIDKTLTTLDGVEGEWRLYSDSGASGLKHIEIALCKLRVNLLIKLLYSRYCLCKTGKLKSPPVDVLIFIFVKNCGRFLI